VQYDNRIDKVAKIDTSSCFALLTWRLEMRMVQHNRLPARYESGSLRALRQLGERSD
jgi:hypothetical protein